MNCMLNGTSQSGRTVCLYGVWREERGLTRMLAWITHWFRYSPCSFAIGDQRMSNRVGLQSYKKISTFICQLALPFT